MRWFDAAEITRRDNAKWREKATTMNNKPWERWFAWHPVKIGNEWVWFETIERKPDWWEISHKHEDWKYRWPL